MSLTYKRLNHVQSRAKKAALRELRVSGKALIRMATGTGKTETAIKVFESLDKKQDKRILWLTHQKELVFQSAERFLDRSLAHNKRENRDIGLFYSEDKATQNKIIVASIQSMARNLDLFDPNDFDIIAVDEAHHGPAEQWTKVIEYFRAKKLGFTATPYRPDGQSLEGLFGKLCFDLPFKDAQRKKLLAKDKTFVIVTNSVLEGFVDLGGEYNRRQLDRLYTSKNRNKIIVESYLKYGRKEARKLGLSPKAICYCINSKHALRMQRLFQSAGVKVIFVSGSSKLTSGAKREELMRDFKTTNKYEILCVVDLMNEGVDVPDANIGIMCRPTQSNIIYSQQIGRIARINNGKKKYFIVLDYVDQTNTQFQAYGIGNLKGSGYQPKEIVTEYLSRPDKVVRQKIANDIMKKAEEFEVAMRKKFDAEKVNAENAEIFIKSGFKKAPWRV